MNINKTDIINAGMYAIGAKKIFAPTDNTKAARLANSIYEYMKNLVFEAETDWYWAMARSGQLAQLADPVTGYDHQYALPDNTAKVISMIDLNGDEIEYEWEPGLFIETGDTTKTTKVLRTDVDEGDVYIKYIVYIDDVSLYPAWFAQLISLNIALYIAEPVKQHSPHYAKVKDMLEKAVVFAEEANAQMGVRTGRTTRQSLNKGNNDLVNAASIAGVADRVNFFNTLGIR